MYRDKTLFKDKLFPRFVSLAGQERNEVSDQTLGSSQFSIHHAARRSSNADIIRKNDEFDIQDWALTTPYAKIRAQ